MIASGHGWARVVAVLTGLAVVACVITSHSLVGMLSTTSPAQATMSMAVPSSGEVMAAPRDGATVAAGLGGPVMGCDGMSGSGAVHGCLAALTMLVLVALAVVLAVVAGGRGRHGGPLFVPSGYVVAARGAPPWTVLSRSQLSVIRV